LTQMHMGTLRIPQMQKLAWDPVRDFTYIIGLSGYTFGVVVKSDSPFKSFQDLLDWAKDNPGKLTYGSTGTGTSPHLLMEEVSIKTGAQFLHVPFKGNADSTQALLGGHVMAQSDSSGWGRFVDAGQFRLLLTSRAHRTHSEARAGHGVDGPLHHHRGPEHDDQHHVRGDPWDGEALGQPGRRGAAGSVAQ